MPNPQPGIFALGTRSHHHLEWDVTGEPSDVLSAITRIRDQATAVAGVNVVVGFGLRMWAKISPEQVPLDLADFTPVVGLDGFTMPASQHDLWLWLHAASPDAIFNVARLAATELSGLALVAAENPSFTYLSSQDLTGFEDGTENPPLTEAMTVATIAEGLPCAGGSVVLVQRWIHDLDGFEALEIADREEVIGRTLLGSVELDETRQPSDSHVSRVVITDDDGVELEIFRRSTAFGGVTEHGLMFIAFSADRTRLVRMLERMSGADDGQRDRLTRFSTPVAGSWYVAPPIDLLKPL
jgi:porphyrinogen peroxidase